MRSNQRITLAGAGALGIAGLAVGVAVPNLMAYRIGIVLLALGSAAATYLCTRARVGDPTGGSGRIVVTAAAVGALIVPLAAGASVPRLAADDGTWSARQYAPIATTIAGQTYLVGPGRVTVVSADSGDLAWRADTVDSGAGNAIIGPKGDVLMLDRSRPARLYAPDGSVRWTKPPAPVDSSYSVVAFDDNSIVVATNCRAEHTDCRLVGIGRDGHVAWQHDVSTDKAAADELQTTVNHHRLNGSLPSTLAITVTGSKRRAVAMIDTETGGTQGTVSIPAGADLGFGAPYPVGHGVLISFDRPKGCEWRMYEAGERVWDLKGSTFCSGPGYAGRVVSTPESRRAYVQDTADGSWFTINLRSGHARSLTPEEGLDAMGPSEASRHRRMGADTILVERHRTLVATDADSGKQLWTRHMDSRVEGMALGHGRAVVSTAYTGHNPVLLRDSEGFGPPAISVHLIALRTGDVVSTTALHGSNFWIRSLAGGALLSRSTPAADHRAPLDTDTAIYLAGTPQDPVAASTRRTDDAGRQGPSWERMEA